MSAARSGRADPAPTLSARERLATRAAVATGALSKWLGFGGGSVIGGRVALIVDRDLLAALSRGRTVALVSGTNGKTTTTRLLAAAMGGPKAVATSSAGANLPSGLVAALSASPEPGSTAVMEVDEGYLPAVVEQSAPAVVTLLNLSRDQLDRVSEVRMVASRWRSALGGREGLTVVANADDPLVAWAAQPAPPAPPAHRVIWVGAGQLWHSDAVGCPACIEGRVVFAESDGHERSRHWECSCGFARPRLDAWLEDDELVLADATRVRLDLAIPGAFNRANAAMAALASTLLGVGVSQAVEAMRSVREVEGRFSTARHDGTDVRLLLAKNPAGWTELLGLIRESAGPVVIGINARIADGHDPSWLWDVPFEALAGRFVVATGERCCDLAVRLRHAGVHHEVVASQLAALTRAASLSAHVEYVGNYTAFQQLRRALGSGGGDSSGRDEPAFGGRPRAVGESRPEVPPTSAPSIPGASRRASDGVSALRVVVVHPDLLGTYGDGGNGLVLTNRARWRDIDAELSFALSDDPLPAAADIYCLGGGEDGPQVRSAELLANGALARALDAGAAVLAVCAGYQVVGNSFPDAQGNPRSGVGLLDISTAKGPARRAVGELLAVPLLTSAGQESSNGSRLPVLTGFENHSGVTSLGPGVAPLARVVRGTGNGGGDGSEGAVAGRVVGTYMHGPVLARNAALADMLLQMVTGSDLSPLADEEETALREERLRAVQDRSRAGGAFRRLGSFLDTRKGRQRFVEPRETVC